MATEEEGDEVRERESIKFENGLLKEKATSESGGEERGEGRGGTGAPRTGASASTSSKVLVQFRDAYVIIIVRGPSH